MIFFIIFLILLLLVFASPWIDIFTDYRGIKHIILWYTNMVTGERKFIDLIGGDQE